MSMRKQIHCTLMLWDATHDKVSVFPWFPGLLFYLPMRSYLSRACFFKCSLTIPWEVIFPWFPGLVFYVHWPSHDKLSFCGFQGPLMHEHEKTFYYHRGIQIIIIIIIIIIDFPMRYFDALPKIFHLHPLFRIDRREDLTGGEKITPDRYVW